MQVFKADLFHQGGSVFKEAKEVFISLRPFSFSDKSFHSTESSEISFKTVSLALPCKPHGASWGRASGVLFPFWEDELPAVGCWVGLPRESLPPLTSKEFYICDILGRQVLDEQGRDFGRVVGFSDVAPTLGSSVNLQVRSPQGTHFEFPAAWVVDFSDQTKIIVPDVSSWLDLDPRQTPDD